MNDLINHCSVEKLPAVLDSRVVVEKLNVIRREQGQVDKLHLTFLRDLDVEIEKLKKEQGNTDLYIGINIEVFFNPNGTRSHVSMCEDTADMMLSRESPSVRVAMKRELRKALSAPTPVPTNLSPELALFKTMLDSAIALETKQKALEQRTEAIEQKLEATTTKDDECLSSSQIQELESLFKQIFLISKNGQQIGQIKAMLKAKFLKCPASSCTYKDIAQKHYPACKKIVSAFL